MGKSNHGSATFLPFGGSLGEDCFQCFARVTASSAASADGFEVGGRLGYGIPMGEASDGNDLSDAVSGQIPLTLDVGYRAIDALFIGLYLGYGFGFLASDQADTCDAINADCSVSTFDLGLQAQYHLAPGSGTDFWFGGGLGYESLTTGSEAGGTSVDVTASALPQIMLQLGVDFGDDPKLGFGPFLRFTHATFTKYSGECDGDGCNYFTFEDGDIPDDSQAGHQWLTIGVRGTFMP